MSQKFLRRLYTIESRMLVVMLASRYPFYHVFLLFSTNISKHLLELQKTAKVLVLEYDFDGTRIRKTAYLPSSVQY